MPRTLWIYCANLHHGGIVVSAASFLDEVERMHEEGWFSIYSEIRVTASRSVALSMTSSLANVDRPIHFEIHDEKPWTAPFLSGSPSDVRLIFSGPEYRRRMASLEVCGFHDANILGSSAETISNSGLRTGLKRAIQRRITRNYDAFFTETPSMARELSNLQPDKPVRVIPNAPSAVFSDQSQWIPNPLPPPARGTIRLLFPGRGYPHKNHIMLPQIIRLFEVESGIKLEVVTTLRPSELRALGLESAQGIINIGEVTVQQLPGLYLSTDGVIFPSLKELASVTPLEGMTMRKPVFASDRDFVWETCGPNVNYMDPTNASDIVRVLKAYFLQQEGADLEVAYDFAQGLPTPQHRAQMLMRFVNDLAKSGTKRAFSN